MFDWLASGLSFQGVSNEVASNYMDRHGRPTWRDIGNKLGRGPTCPKLTSYWHFHGCRQFERPPDLASRLDQHRPGQAVRTSGRISRPASDYSHGRPSWAAKKPFYGSTSLLARFALLFFR
jgi:hypothetical protein